MARSKAFEALLEEAGKTVRKSGETLKEIVMSDTKTDTEGQADRQTVKQTLRQADKQTDRHSDRQTSRQTDRQTSGQSDRHSVKQSDGHSDRHSLRQSDRHSDEQSVDDPFYWITEKQAEILSFLINNERKITSLEYIARTTGIPYGTVRGSIDKLVKEKCISKPSRYRKGQFQGIKYSINESLCEQFKDHEKYRQSDRHSDKQSDEHSDRHSLRQADKQTLRQTVSYISSSSLLYKTTTTSAEIEAVLSDHPELGYWRQKGLSPKQIEEWMKVAKCNFETMVQYLCWCRFDMVDLDQEKKKSIGNVFNWFFRIIEKTGGYPRPKGYKSHADKQIETERFLCEEQEKKIRELKELAQKKWDQERDIKFWKMMNDKDGEIYKKCFEQLNDIEKRKAAMGGKVFELGMRREFDKIIDSEDANTC